MGLIFEGFHGIRRLRHVIRKMGWITIKPGKEPEQMEGD